MKAYLVANGLLPSPDLVAGLAEVADLVVGVDGGVRALVRAGQHPNLVIGDLDSLTDDLQEGGPRNLELVQVVDQDKTDLEKALDELVRRGVAEVVLSGVCGKRADHFLTNLSVVAQFRRSLALSIVEDGGIGFFIEGPVRRCIQSFPGQTVSLISFTGAYGVTTEGLQWNILKGDLEFGKRLSQSNTVVGDDITIQVEQGLLFVWLVAPE
jgi:thiamine pyrophosphokinase